MSPNPGRATGAARPQPASGLAVDTREGGSKRAWLHPMWAGGKRDKVWLWGVHKKLGKNSYFWQLFPTGVEVAIGMQGPVRSPVKSVRAGQCWERC